jgi:molecular chaperone DnaK
MASDNVSLGRFNLEGIPPAPRGVPQIEVTYDIDANGILNVSAKDMATNKEQKITITASTKLSDTEKESMMKQAEEFAEEDKKRKEEVEFRNNADSLIYTSERTKADLKDKISAEQAGSVDKAVSELKEALKGTDTQIIKQKTEDLNKLLQEIGAAVYQQTAAQGPQPAEEAPGQQQGPEGGEPSPPEEKVVDAEAKVVDNEKK